jgi:hypothetical protein
MLGFKRFDHAVVTIRGIELAEKIKKGQFQDWQARRWQGRVRTMERGARCLIPIESTDAAERTRYRTSPEFASESAK